MASHALRVNTEALLQFRKERGFTGTSFAEAIGIDRTYLSKIEAGKRDPSPPIAKRMAEVLKINIGAILATPKQTGEETA